MIITDVHKPGELAYPEGQPELITQDRSAIREWTRQGTKLKTLFTTQVRGWGKAAEQRYCAIFDVPLGGDPFALAKELGPEITWGMAENTGAAIPSELKGKLLTDVELYQAVPELAPVVRKSRQRRARRA